MKSCLAVPANNFSLSVNVSTASNPAVDPVYPLYSAPSYTSTTGNASSPAL